MFSRSRVGARFVAPAVAGFSGALAVALSASGTTPRAPVPTFAPVTGCRAITESKSGGRQ